MADDALKEMTAQYREQKTRASDLSGELSRAREEIKTWQDEAAQVDTLKERIAELETDLEAATQQNAALTKAVADADLSASQVQKRADAFVQIREALAVK